MMRSKSNLRGAHFSFSRWRFTDVKLKRFPRCCQLVSRTSRCELASFTPRQHASHDGLLAPQIECSSLLLFLPLVTFVHLRPSRWSSPALFRHMPRSRCFPMRRWRESPTLRMSKIFGSYALSRAACVMSHSCPELAEPRSLIGTCRVLAISLHFLHTRLSTSVSLHHCCQPRFTPSKELISLAPVAKF